jgi:hypothetical protein
MRYTIHRRTERPKTRRRRNYEVVQGPSHRFEAATPEVAKRLGVGSEPAAPERAEFPTHAARERRARAYCCDLAMLNGQCTEPRTLLFGVRLAAQPSGVGPLFKLGGLRGPSVRDAGRREMQIMLCPVLGWRLN